MKTSFILTALAIAVFLSPKVYSQWQPQGMVVCDANEDQTSTRTISDGNGGAFILWNDYRFPHLYAQRLNSYGVPQWGQNGITLCAFDQSPVLETFAFGNGFILTWQGTQTDSTRMFMQAYDANGGEIWQTNGVPIVTGKWAYGNPRLCTDGEFFYVSWSDWRLSKLDDIFLQKYNISAGAEWQANGICVRSAPHSQNIARPIRDGSGGAYVVWVDDSAYGGGPSSQSNLFVQRVSSAGVLQWQAEGKAICTAPNKQSDYDVINSGKYGYIVWEDYRSGKSQVYAQKWNENGSMLWGNNGMLISGVQAGIRFGGKVVSDGAGGIIIVYYDFATDVTAIRLDANGNTIWSKSVCSLKGKARNPFSVVSNGAGGVAVAWSDNRNTPDIYDFYANIIDVDGNYVWNSQGVVLVQKNGKQENVSICYNGSDAIIGAWHENTTHMRDVYAGKCKSFGAVPVELVSFSGKQIGLDVNLKWQTASETNNTGFFVERNVGDGWATLFFIKGNGTSAIQNNYEYTDYGAGEQNVSEIYYRLKQVDFDGTENHSAFIAVKLAAKSAENVLQNYPNPFSARTMIEFYVSNQTGARLAIYNMLGRKVWEEMVEQVGWQKKDFINQNLPRGNYWLRLSGQKTVQKMITIY